MRVKSDRLFLQGTQPCPVLQGDVTAAYSFSRMGLGPGGAGS